MEYILAILGLCSAAGAAVTVVRQRWRERRLMEQLSQMLDCAIDGSFVETEFDETCRSALESRMYRFLSSNAFCRQSIGEERDRIKQLVADISHQTKTPIANIQLYAQILEEQPLPPESRKAVKALSAQSRKLSFLIGSLIKLSRLETGIITVAPENHKIMDLFCAVSEQVQPKAREKGVEVIFVPTDLTAMFDGKWMAEALYNLADNGVKYTPAGGFVRISAQAYELFCRIDVWDSGIGIPEEDMSRIFGRFFRGAAVSEEEGVGIGLFLAREIVTAHKGYIKAVSSPGKGSRFSVFVPREHVPSAEKAKEGGQ